MIEANQKKRLVCACTSSGSITAAPMDYFIAEVVNIEHVKLVVIRLSLGRRLVNLLPVAQRTNALTNGVFNRPWVVGREFESHVHPENSF